MKIRKDKYTQVLLWAYDKQNTGFTWEELKQECSLSDSEESWVKKIFNTTDDRDRKFVEHFRNDDSVKPNVHYYSLNEKGMSAALAALESRRIKRKNTIAMLIAGIAAFTGIGALVVAIWTGILTQRSLQVTQQTFELSAQPTIFIESPSQEFGIIRNVGTSTEFVLKNNSPTKIKDVFIYVTLMKTFYETDKKVLVIGPATQYVNDNGVFRNYGIDLEQNTSYQGISLFPLQEYVFSIFWPDDYGSLNECGPAISQYNVYKGKFKYFLRIDVSYKRVIDNKTFSYTKFYSLGENDIIVDLEEKDEALNWIISDDGDTLSATYIIPFKSKNLTEYITKDTPPYDDLGTSYVSYDPSTDNVFIDPIRSREFSLCMRINLQSLEPKE